MGIGEKLARQRNLLGISADDIAAATGMSLRQITAIEADTHQFAAPADVNRMIRLYARKLGVTLDADPPGIDKRCAEAAAVVLPPPPIPGFLLKQAPSRAE